MVSSPSATHESVLNAIIEDLTGILAAIPIPKTLVACRTMAANIIRGDSVHTIPDLTILMCTKGGLEGQPIWLMESSFSQSDHDVMRKLESYAKDIPKLLVVGKILIKQTTPYHSPGSNVTIASRLQLSELMTRRDWTCNLEADEFAQVVVDGHTWFSLSAVEIHMWLHQASKPKICLGCLDDGYTFGVCFMSTQFYILTFIHFHLMVQTLYPAENLDEINKAFQCGLELVKEAVLLVSTNINILENSLACDCE